jgi:anti-sigma factor RsiW
VPSERTVATDCDRIAEMLPGALDAGEPVELEVARHVETCLRCQAELARYRKMLRGLHLLRTRYVEPAPGAVLETLAAIQAESERRALRSVLSGRGLAYAGAIGGALAAGAAATAVLIARSRRHTTHAAA